MPHDSDRLPCERRRVRPLGWAGVLAVGAVAMLGVRCGDDDAPAAKVDPFEVYLANAPADAPELSRGDAQARALLGCGQPWAPGTVDAALADAYKALCR